MILDIIRIIGGILISMFIPGYLLSLILYKKINIIERICLAFGFSVFIIVFLGFFLTGVSYTFNIKGITSLSVWLSLSLVSIIFALGILVRR